MSMQMQYYDPDERTPVDLTAGEMREYQEQVAIIRENLKAFYRVGAALKRIKDGKLYRQDYKTFEDFCDRHLDIGRSQANRLVAGAGMLENIAPMGAVLPANERQARPLAKLEKYGEAAPDLQRQAWQIAVEKAETLSSGITARVVEEAVGQVMEKRGFAPARNSKALDPEAINRMSPDFRTAHKDICTAIERAAAHDWKDMPKEAALHHLRVLIDFVKRR